MLNPDDIMHMLLESMPLAELNRRYFLQVAIMEPPFDILALDRKLFVGSGDSQAIISLHEVHPLVICLPWLLRGAFPIVAETDLLDIAEAGMFLMLALLLQDHYFDGQVVTHIETILLHQRLHMLGIQKFYALFDAGSPFWVYFEKYLRQYTTALIRESRYCAEQPTQYSMAEMYKLGSGKVALLKAVTTAAALKSGAATYVSRLETAIDALTAALQLGDDITDWAEDYEHRRYTLPLLLAIPAEQWPTPRLSVAELGSIFEHSFVLEGLLRQVIVWFQQAQHAMSDLACPLWTELLECFLARARALQISLLTGKLFNLVTEKTSLGTISYSLNDEQRRD